MGWRTGFLLISFSSTGIAMSGATRGIWDKGSRLLSGRNIPFKIVYSVTRGGQCVSKSCKLFFLPYSRMCASCTYIYNDTFSIMVPPTKKTIAEVDYVA